MAHQVNQDELRRIIKSNYPDLIDSLLATVIVLAADQKVTPLAVVEAMREAVTEDEAMFNNLSASVGAIRAELAT